MGCASSKPAGEYSKPGQVDLADNIVCLALCLGGPSLLTLGYRFNDPNAAKHLR